MSTTVRVLRGRKGRLSKWFVEVDDAGDRRLIEYDGRVYWDSKRRAIHASREWVSANGVKAVFVIPTRDGR